MKSKTYSARYVTRLQREKDLLSRFSNDQGDLLRKSEKRIQDLEQANNIYHEHLKYMFQESLRHLFNRSCWSEERLLKEIPTVMHRAGRVEL